MYLLLYVRLMSSHWIVPVLLSSEIIILLMHCIRGNNGLQKTEKLRSHARSVAFLVWWSLVLFSSITSYDWCYCLVDKTVNKIIFRSEDVAFKFFYDLRYIFDDYLLPILQRSSHIYFKSIIYLCTFFFRCCSHSEV